MLLMKMFMSSLTTIIFLLGFFFFTSLKLKFLFEMWMLKIFPLYILLDKLSYLFMLMLLMIVGSVLSFSSYYMNSDFFSSRFINILLMFVLSMLILIIIPDFFFLLLGWDGLGLSSFLLIIYYSSDKSWQCGFKTFLINRLGDGLIMIVMSTMMSKCKFYLSSLDMILSSSLMLVLFLGLMTKSAQFPFSSWLPAAMAAPTPVSALVHSSTLVTSGLYLMIRNMKWFNSSFFILLFLVGVWTLTMASLAASIENDLKKIIAYSTLSQLGLMSLMMSIKLVQMGFFHLLTHACFKALLFILGGIFLFKFYHNQDIRFFGQDYWIKSLMKMSFITVKFSLCGLIFLSGFYSKDSLMEKLFPKLSCIINLWLIIMASLTLFYSFRLIFSVTFKTLPCPMNNLKYLSLKSMMPLFIMSFTLGNVLNNKLKIINMSSTKKKMILSFMIIIYMYLYIKLKIKAKSYFFSISKTLYLKSYFLVNKLSLISTNIEQFVNKFKNKILMKNLNLMKSQESLIFHFNLLKKSFFSYWWVMMMLGLLLMMI